MLDTLAWRSGLNNQGGVSRVHAAGQKYPRITPKLKQRRARTTIPFNKINARTKIQTQPDKTIRNMPQIQQQIQRLFHKTKRAKFQCARKYKPWGNVRTKCARVVFFARGLVCANATRSESRDKTMFRRSKWYRLLALDPLFVACQRERKDSNVRDAEMCVR